MNLEFYNYYGDLAFAYPHQNHLKVKPLLEWFCQEDSSLQSSKMGKYPASKLAKSTHPNISQTVWFRTMLINKSNDLHICLNNIYYWTFVLNHFRTEQWAVPQYRVNPRIGGMTVSHMWRLPIKTKRRNFFV